MVLSPQKMYISIYRCVTHVSVSKVKLTHTDNTDFGHLLKKICLFSAKPVCTCSAEVLWWLLCSLWC